MLKLFQEISELVKLKRLLWLVLDFMLATFILSHNSGHKVDHLSVFKETVGPKCAYQNPKNRYWTLKATSRGYLGSPPVKKKQRSNQGHYRSKNKPCLVLSRNLLVEITEFFWNKQDCIHFFDILPAQTISLFLIIFGEQLLKFTFNKISNYFNNSFE